jgi:hypothetical protein
VPARRRRRWLRRLVVAALAAGLVLGVGVGAWMLRGGDRARAAAAVRSIPLRLALAKSRISRAAGATPGPPSALRCAPARTVGAPGEVRDVGAVPPSETATALFLWPEVARDRAAELRAVRALAGASQLREFPGSPQALALTADGAVLRRARQAAPSAHVQLAAAGTRELCYLGA